MGIISRFQNRRQLFNDRQPTKRALVRFSGGTVINEDTQMEISSYFRAVTYLSTQIAKLPLFIKDRDNKLIPNTIFDFFNKNPNPEMSAFMFKTWIVQTTMNHGNAFVEIERDVAGRPIALWPIRDEYVFPYRLSVAPYDLVYGVYPSSQAALKNEEGLYLPKEDVLHFTNFYTKDGIVGQGISAYAYDTMGIGKGADKFANSLFSNSGIPSGVLTTAGVLNEAAYARLKSDWKEQMGGKKTGSTAILEDGVKYEPVSFQPDVMQFLESRKFTVSEIARFTGISPQKLYDIDAQRYGDVEQDSLAFGNDSVSPWTAMIESQINFKLLTGRMSPLVSKFNLYDLFNSDMETRSKYFKDRMNTGSMTPNQIRMAEGEEPYEGGDRYYIATNNFTPLDKMDALIDSQIAKGQSNDNDPSKNPAPPPAETNANAQLVQALTNYYEKKSKDGK